MGVQTRSGAIESTSRAACGAVIAWGTPLGISSHSTACSRQTTWVRRGPGRDSVAAIRSLNDAIAADPRVKVLLMPIGDGVSFVQKLGERQS